MSKVTLVGAGPGDASLITMRGLHCIQQADCILYDRLIDPILLTYAKPECELIYVGKQASHHMIKQEEINALLVQKAGVFEHVVRLKGGDAYVLGRGGEEALYLKKHHIPFSVVPGVTSSIAALTYAGIPITHRGITGGFRVISAHNKQDEFAALDFPSMVDAKETIVFMMGLANLKQIVNGFLQAGKHPSAKIAVISHATLPTQKVIVSDFQHIADEIKQHPLSSPAVIVVGEVISLREQLNFFETTPLFHASIWIPKIGSQPLPLSLELKELGAQVEEVQVSELHPFSNVLASVSFSDYEYVVFTSKRAVRYFMEDMRRCQKDVRLLAHMKIAVIGKATAQCLSQYGVFADIIPKEAHREALYDALQAHVTATDRILFPHVKEEWKTSLKLKELGHVKDVILYENKRCKIRITKEQLHKVDVIVFNCSSAVRYVMEDIDSAWVNDKKIVSIGESTSETLRSYGVSYEQAVSATYASIRDKIVELWEESTCIEAED